MTGAWLAFLDDWFGVLWCSCAWAFGKHTTKS